MMDLLGELAEAGRTILFSSHILEEVERVGTDILVMVAGRLAASGDFRAIRALMTDRPHSITIRSSDDRRLATTLMADPAVFAVELTQAGPSVQTAHLSAFRSDHRGRQPIRRRASARGRAGRRVARERLRLPGAPMSGAGLMGPLAAFPEIVRVTLRQLLGRRRTLLLVLLAALPVLLALAFRAGGPDRRRALHPPRLRHRSRMTILLPLVAILFGSGAFGAEIDDGTVVYLLAKPVAAVDGSRGQGLHAPMAWPSC